MNANQKIKNVFLTLAVALSVNFVSCASKNLALVSAKKNYDSVKNNPDIVRDAPVALNDAKQTLDKAEELSKNSKNKDEVTHLAYLANKKVEVAKSNAVQKMYQTQLNQTGQNRNEVVLQARTREVDAANARAQAALNKTQEAEYKTTEAEERTRIAQGKTKESQERERLNQAELQKSEQRESDLAKELKDLKSVETEIGTQLTLRDMMFEIGKAELTSGGARDVSKITQIAKSHPNRDIVVEGHTDSMGTKAYNQDLSERRARTVEALLESEGIPSDKVTIKGYGKSFPVASNGTSAGRQLNRRVVVTILHEGKKPSDIEHKSK